MDTLDQNVKAIFLEAVENHASDNWPAFLDQACGQDTELRRRVELLLHAHQEQDSLFDAEPTATGQKIAAVGDRIGNYKLLEQIGEGGYGIVFVAEQTEPIQRYVALKIVKPGMDTREVIARFEAERQTLALMDHPNIARIFDGGTTGSGLPFFVMELVRGVPITEYCDTNRLSMKERLCLFKDVCDAVHHAHRKGIIHRDLKPTNVLVTMKEGIPAPKVIDFGVAKALNHQLGEHTVYTRYGVMIGTPLYMSPEQAGMSASDVDTRSDVYSLGVLLYELVTGTTPFDKERIKQAAYDEIRRVIREEEPVAPSARISTLGDSAVDISIHRHTTPPQLSALLRGELDWIVLKAIEKDRNRRYDAASEFAEDIERFLNNDVVRACPPSRLYRLRKYVKKHKVRLATGSILAIALLAVAVSISFAYVAHQRGEQERRILRLDSEAQTATATGNDEVAVDKFTQLLQLQRNAYGRQSQPVVSTLRARAESLARLGRYAEAVACRHSLADISIKMLGIEHVDSRKAMEELVDIQLEAARHNIEAANAAALTDAIESARSAISITEKHNLDAWRPVMKRRTRSGYALLIESLYKKGDIKTCHDEARHWLGLPTSAKHYALRLYLALLNMEEGREAIAADWFLAADQLWLGGSGSWKVTQRALRNEAAARILGSPDAIPPQISTEEEEALFTRLLQHYPQAAILRHRRGYCRVQLGKWDEAQNDFAKAIDQMPAATVFVHASHALLSLHQERMDDYQSECQWLVEYLQRRRRISERHAAAVIPCLVSPKAKVDYDVMYRLAGPNPLTTGIAAYRLGKYTEAIDLLQSHRSGRRLALRFLFEAMAHYRLGALEEAKTSLDKARQLIDQDCPLPGRPKATRDVSYFTSVVWCEALAALREAEALIENGGPQPDSSNKDKGN